MKEKYTEYFLFVYKINYRFPITDVFIVHTDIIEVKLEVDYGTSDIDEIVLAYGEAAKQIKKSYENVELNSIDEIQLIQRYVTSRLKR